MAEWLIEADDGIRRTWLGEATDAEAEQIRRKLEGTGEWNCQVTKRSFQPDDKADLAVDVHVREWSAGGEVGPKPFKAVP